MTGIDAERAPEQRADARPGQEPLTFDDALAGLQAKVDDLLDGVTGELRVLDAGCGGQMYLTLQQPAWVVGIDVSPEQLERNDTIDERILGDIQTYPLLPRSFDVVICWDVLEHLRRPEKALENLGQSVRPGGLLILGGPNALSFKGLITWITPFWVHRAWYQLSNRAAGTAPFRTYRHSATLPSRVAPWAAGHFESIEYFVLYESPLQSKFRMRVGLTDGAWSSLEHRLTRATGGRFDLAATDFMMAAKR